MGRRGRKPISPDQQRRHAVTCRLTDAERARVDASRGAVTRGEYLRRAALGNPPRLVPELNRVAYAELARLSSNLNQLLRGLNSGQGDADEAVQLVAEVRGHVTELRRDLLGISDPDPGAEGEG